MTIRAAAFAGLLVLLVVLRGGGVSAGGGVVGAVGGSAAPGAPAPRPTDGVVHVSIHFSRFDPERIVVEPGQTVRFVIENTDPIDHEFIVGDERVQLVHEEGIEAHHDPRPGEVSVPSGAIVETTYTFPEGGAGSLIFGCHLPGHYDFGMRGTVTIA